MNGEQPRILEALQDAKMRPLDDLIARRLENAEVNMVRCLDEIVRRAEELRGLITSGRPDRAAFWIADSAGASGPIGSTYEKLTAAAAEMNVLIQVGITREEL